MGIICLFVVLLISDTLGFLESVFNAGMNHDVVYSFIAVEK